MSEPAIRPVLILDDDRELISTLSLFELVLVELLQPFDENDPSPPPGLGLDEVNGLERVLTELLYEAECVDIYDPCSRFQYGKLSVCWPLVADLDAIGRALNVIGDAARNPHSSYLREVVEDISGSRAADFLHRVERAYRTLNLEPDEDQGLLCQIVTENTDRVVLDANQEGAYRRLIYRLLDIRDNDPLERFLYLGNGTPPRDRR